MIKKVITAAMIASATIAGAQNTKILTAEKSNEYGIVYSLPLTALEVEITARHQVAKQGPFFLYAKKSIGNDNVVREDAEKWEITEVKVTPYGVPDSETQYLMQLKPGALTFVAVDADGMLLAINKETQSRPAADSRQNTSDSQTKWPTGREYLEFVDEDFVASQSPARQAQLLAESLMEVRESRLSLTRGTADTMPTDGKQLELMLNSLAQQESALTNAFTGSVTSEYVTRKFTFIPESEGKEILFRLSDFAGFVDSDDLSGDAVYVETSILNQAKLPVDSKGEEKKIPKNAVVYNLPGSAQVTLSLLGKKLFDKEIQFSQFGTQFGLDPSLFTDKKEPSFATFDPVTGALVEVGKM
ncbi:MAG: DUF4831 family protein [Muribaculum sp.]|nr:DUF4831 family protein [Muribaculum sp.]